jgi:EAL domain-containing protein (putative c-di-GMP-specific phosphodiesterase class I)
MTEPWKSALERLRFAFQPIALSSNGQAYGYEALLRGWKEAGFHSIDSVFDCAFLENNLPELDRSLRSKSLADFASWAPAGTKLFYNLDNRIFRSGYAGLEPGRR